VIIRVSIDQDRSAFERSIAKTALPIPQIFAGGEQSELVQLFNARAVPVSYLIDPEGKIVARISGPALLRTTVEKAMEKAKEKQ